MENWLQSIHSDGTKTFLSNPLPKLGETVKVRLRLSEHSPVKHVLLLAFPNGIDDFHEMSVLKTEHGLTYYETEIKAVIDKDGIHPIKMTDFQSLLWRCF